MLVFGLYLILSLTKTSLDVGKYLTELENNFKNILNYDEEFKQCFKFGDLCW